MIKRRVCSALALVFLGGAAFAQTKIESLVPVGSIVGTEIYPLSLPQGGSVYLTRRATTNQIYTFVRASLLAGANTWTAGQTFNAQNIFGAQNTFSAAPVFTSLTGYLYANGSSAITASTTIPAAAITGALAGSNIPAPGASSLGGVLSSSAPANQFATGVNTSGVIQYAQPSFADISGSFPFTSLSGTIATGQIPSGTVTLGQLANISANTIVGNNTGSPAIPVSLTVSAALDMISSTQGSILYRGASAWLALAPGVAGQFLQTNGAAANPSWEDQAAVIPNSYQLLATLNPSGVTNITSTSLAAYSDYYITIDNLTVAADATVDIGVSTNNGSGYTNCGLTLGNGTGGATKVYGYANVIGANTPIVGCRGRGYSSASSASGTIDDEAYVSIGGQINALRISASSGNMSVGTIKIYGR